MNIDAIKDNVQIEDGQILLGKPLEIEKYGKRIIIQPINWFYDWNNFSYCLGVFLKYYYIICDTVSLPDKLGELMTFRDNIRVAISQKVAFRMLCKICKYSGLNRRWMKKHFTVDDWVEIFIYVYLFNIMGVKKNLKSALKLIGVS